MVLSPSHPCAHLATRDRARYGTPPLDAAALARWCEDALAIRVRFRRGLAAEGVALALLRSPLRGLVLVRAGVPWPRLTIAHEVGHLMTGHTYGLELCTDDARWKASPAERGADNYALCLLLAAEDVLDGCRAGWDDDQIGAAHHLPGFSVFRRKELAHLTGECPPLDAYVGHPAHASYLRARGVAAPHWWTPDPDEPA